MVVLVVTAAYWTEETTVACGGGPSELAVHEKHCTDQLMNIVELVRGRSPATTLARMSGGA